MILTIILLCQEKQVLRNGKIQKGRIWINTFPMEVQGVLALTLSSACHYYFQKNNGINAIRKKENEPKYRPRAHWNHQQQKT